MSKENDNKIHFTTHNGLMYYDGCPVFDQTDEWLTYENFMKPMNQDSPKALFRRNSSVISFLY